MSRAVSRPLALSRLCLAPLSRAHVALGAHPELAERGRAAAARVAEVLSAQLDAKVFCEARLLPSPVRPGRCLASLSAFLLLELAGLGAVGVLELERPLLAGLLDRLSGSEPRPTVPLGLTRIEEAACGYLALLCLAAVREVGALEQRFAPRLLSVHESREALLARVDADAAHLAIDLTLTMGKVVGVGRLLLPAKPLLRALGRSPVPSEGQGAPGVLAARLRAHLLGGSARLDTDALDSLVEGDVVLLDGLAWSAGALVGAARLATRTFRLRGRLGPEGLSTHGAEVQAPATEVRMVVGARDQTQPFPPLPVELEVELKRLLLPLAELAQLRPGALLPVTLDLQEPVLLRVGDRPIARAQLVDLEGEVGARILELLP